MAERELDELFRAWRSEPVPPSLPPGVDDRGGSAVVAAALRRVADQKRQKQRTRKLFASLALAAAFVGLGVGAWYSLGNDAVVAQADASVMVGGREGDVAVTDDVGHVVEAVSALAEGYGVRTEQGSATLGFPSGASAKVSSKSSLKITRTRQSEALFLARGGVDVEVPKLDPTRGFSVETPDARVTVHGTHFSVVVEPSADGPRTRVQVTHGIVSVQQGGREVFLTAGQSWATAVAPSTTEGKAATEPTSEIDAGLDEDDEVDEALPAPAADDKHGARAPRRHFDSRELADQNRRFARAMTHKKNGEPKAALRELGGILKRYPGSPLTQELRVERLRLLRGLGASQSAEREAKRYLREFPQGYAVKEAEELLSGAP
ncbi:MAG TPA: FecR domain-containing protein [Polyangiaceae bacterium]|nr:FecR domain-containing protein [Polyangiaceae bacterium]